MSLSPVKKGRKSTYFNGVLADETSQMKLVGFNGMQQRKLNEYHQKNIAVQLEDCEVKAAHQGEGYEVMLKTYTKISQSPKKLDVTSLMADITTGSKTVKLSSVESMESFERVTVNVKVTDVKDKIEVGGKSKQDVLVGDDSSRIRVAVWESHVNLMAKNKSYWLENFMVREFQGTKYLIMGKEGSNIVAIDDGGPINKRLEEEDELWVINNATVVGVPLTRTNHASSVR